MKNSKLKLVGLGILHFAFCILHSLADGTPTIPATQTEVNAGVIHNKYVAPDTLAGWTGGGGGPTNGQTASQVTNIANFRINVFSNALPVGVSLKAFGAVGDGVTDDTTAVQNWANFICQSNLLGIVPPGSVGYRITSAIQFTNNCKIAASAGGVVYGGSDFPISRCCFIQSTRGADALDFTSYADSVAIDGLFLTNSAANNFTNRDSCGMKFTGSVGSHICRITQCGAMNFGRGGFPVDLACSTFISCSFTFNGIGLEVTNGPFGNGNYPFKADSCIFAFNYSNQVYVSGTTETAIFENSIITTVADPGVAFVSFAPYTELLSCEFGAGGTNNQINFAGKNAVMENCGWIGSVYGFPGRYSVVATNCNLSVQGLLMESNTLNNCSIYLSGTSKLLASPATDVLYDNGAGVLTTNRAVNSLSFASASYSGITAAQVSGLLSTTNLQASQYGYFDGGTNLSTTLNGNLWTNLDTHFTNYGATTNIVLPADGNKWTVLATNGPHNFFSFGGNNMGAVSVWVTTNGDAQWPPQVQFLGYSNHLTTNCIIDFQPFGGTNKVLGGQSEL